MSESHPRSFARPFLGYACIFGVASLWTLSNYLSKHLMQSVGDTFFTFYMLSHNMLFLLPRALAVQTAPIRETISLNQLVIFSSIRIIALICYNIGINYLRVNKIALLNSSSPAFSFLFAFVFLKAPFSIVAAIAVCASIAGTVLAVHSASGEMSGSNGTEDSGMSILGSVLVLTSCGLWSFASCLLSRYITHEKKINTVFGLLGGFATVIAPAVLLVLHYAGIERFSLPHAKAFGLMTANAVLGNLFTNYMQGVAVVILGPVTVDVGLSSQVLIAAVCDHFVDDANFGLMEILSTLLILTAVGLVGFDQTRTKKVADEIQSLG